MSQDHMTLPYRGEICRDGCVHAVWWMGRAGEVLARFNPGSALSVLDPSSKSVLGWEVFNLHAT